MPMFSHRSALAAAALLTLSSTASFGLPPANPATCGTPDNGQCGLVPGGVPPDPPWDKPGIQDGVKAPVIGGHGDTRKDIKHPPRPPGTAGTPILQGGTSHGSKLQSGQTLFGRSDDQILSSTVLFRMQNDCNLVAYHRSGAAWASNTNGKGRDCRATMQSDGNLVVYDGSGRALWASKTQRFPGAHLVAQEDGNVVIYSGAKAQWSTNSWFRR